MNDSIPSCRWLMLGREETCCWPAKCDGYCHYHANQKVKTLPCVTCGKGTRSKYRACYKKGYAYEKLRHISKMAKKNKERTD